MPRNGLLNFKRAAQFSALMQEWKSRIVYPLLELQRAFDSWRFPLSVGTFSKTPHIRRNSTFCVLQRSSSLSSEMSEADLSVDSRRPSSAG